MEGMTHSDKYEEDEDTIPVFPHRILTRDFYLRMLFEHSNDYEYQRTLVREIPEHVMGPNWDELATMLIDSPSIIDRIASLNCSTNREYIQAVLDTRAVAAADDIRDAIPKYPRWKMNANGSPYLYFPGYENAPVIASQKDECDNAFRINVRGKDALIEFVAVRNAAHGPKLAYWNHKKRTSFPDTCNALLPDPIIINFTPISQQRQQTHFASFVFRAEEEDDAIAIIEFIKKTNMSLHTPYIASEGAYYVVKRSHPMYHRMFMNDRDIPRDVIVAPENYMNSMLGRKGVAIATLKYNVDSPIQLVHVYASPQVPIAVAIIKDKTVTDADVDHVCAYIWKHARDDYSHNYA